MKQEKNIIAKISRPYLNSIFNRTRLFDVMDQYRKHSAIWVSGLPGAGKTTLASSYIESRKLPCIWYQLDEADADSANFFHYMNMAVKKAAHSRGNPLPKLSRERFSNLRVYAVQYFRKLFELVKNPSAIVLDNYQEVPADSVLHELIISVLEQVPSGLSIIILSRTDPPAAMTRLLMNKTMVTIQQGELSLNTEESLGIAGLLDKWKPGLESVPMILELTDGWMAGLVLMLECSNPGDETTISPREMAKELFFNYFAGEIFDKMGPDIQEFLLKTACLPSFTPSAAKKLTGFSKAARVLADMNRRNYFTEKKIQNRTTYQFHPLFREFLLSRARETLDPQRLTALYRKAAEILVEDGQPEGAVLLYRKLEDWPALAGLIRSCAPSFMAQNRLMVLQQWLNSLPPDMLASDPWLLFWSGQCLMPFDPFKSRRFFTLAYERFGKQHDTSGLILSISGAVETILTEWGDFRQLDQWIAKLECLMKETRTFPSGDIEARAVFALFSALMFRKPQHPDMGLWENRMYKLLHSDLNKDIRLMIGGYLSHYRFWTGDITGAGLVIDIIREIMKTTETSPLVFMTFKMQEAVYYWHTADFRNCLDAVNEGLMEADKNGVHLIDNWLLAQEVYARLSLDDPALAREPLDRMKSILGSRRYLDICHYHYLSGLYHLQTGSREQALLLCDESVKLASEVGAPYPEGLNCITAAQIHFAEGNEKKADKLNARARTIGAGMKSKMLEMLSGLNEAYFSLKKGTHRRARNILQNALAIGREKGCLNFPGWQSSIMTELCTEALRAGIEKDYVRGLIRRRDIIPCDPPVDIEDWPWKLKIYTLGRFDVVIDGRPLQFTGKPQMKPLEMLKVLISLGGRNVGQGRLEDLLWPEADGQRARQAMITTLHRLRKLIGYEKAVELSEKKLSLNDRCCWTDVWAIESICSNVDRAFTDGCSDDQEASCLTDSLLTLYKGDFLRDEDNSSWVWPVRTRLRSRFLHTVGTLARAWEKHETHDKAIDLYLRALQVEELAEEFYQGLMKCYRKQGRTAEGLSAYERCREVLSSVLGIAPAEETEAIRASLLNSTS